VVEANGERAFWLPYVEVSDVAAATEEAFRLGAEVLLAPREGPAGWRAVVATQDSGPLAFWQPKR
jgi:predicted enzyme related to lactoylglutathione lyase